MGKVPGLLGGIVDVLEVGDVVVGGEGAAVGVGRIEGLPRHPTLHLYPCLLPHCVVGLLPVCVLCTTFCAHNPPFHQSWKAAQVHLELHSCEFPTGFNGQEV